MTLCAICSAVVVLPHHLAPRMRTAPLPRSFRWSSWSAIRFLYAISVIYLLSAYKGTIIFAVSTFGCVLFLYLAVFRFHIWPYFGSSFGARGGGSHLLGYCICQNKYISLRIKSEGHLKRVLTKLTLEMSLPIYTAEVSPRDKYVTLHSSIYGSVCLGQVAVASLAQSARPTCIAINTKHKTE